jgi:PAS domain S-box-containing protein
MSRAPSRLQAAATSPSPQIRPDHKLELYRRIFENTTDGVAVVDLRGLYVEQNSAHRELIGYTDEELADKTPAVHLGEETFAAVARELARRGHYHGEVLSHNKHGRLRILDLSAFTVYDEAGHPLYYVGVKRDITDRKRNEEELAARMRELQSMYSLSGALNKSFRLEDIYHVAIDAVISTVRADRAAILLFDPDGVMRFKCSSGLSKEYQSAVEGHTPWRPETPDPEPIAVPDVFADPALAQYRDVFAREGIRALAFIPIAYEGRVLGKFMLYFNSPHAFTNEELHTALALAMPVATALDRRRAEAALERSERLATAGRLAATIAHEINNPLSAVLNLVFLLRSIPSSSPEQHVYLAQIDQEVARISQIAKRTLGFYRDDSGPVRLDLAQMVNNVLNLYAATMRARNIHVENRMGTDCTVEAAPGELQQVIANLISNAVDACARGGTITLETDCGDHAVCLSVSDTGHGISADHRPRIFEPFFTTKRDIGTGLGLWISK